MNEIYKKGIKRIMTQIYQSTEFDNLADNVKVGIKTLTLDILKGEIERLEEEKCNVPPQPKNTKNVDELLKYAGRFNFNKALQDQIDYYQEQVKLIDE